MQTVLIPGLGAAVEVTMNAWFEPKISLFAGGHNFSKKNYATYLLTDQKALTNLVIRAFLRFPQHTWKPAGSSEPQVSHMYTQTVEGTFTNIKVADGKLTFSDPGPIDLSGDPGLVWTDDGPQLGTNWSMFQFLEGKAWLHTSNNASISVIKIKLVLGSQDVYVLTWEEATEDAQWNFGVEAGGGGKDAEEASIGRVWDRFREGVETVGRTVDRVRKWIPKVNFERSGGKDTRTQGGQRTLGQLWRAPEWTLALVMPEPKAPKPAPGPFGLPEPYKVYFDTNKSNADNYRSPLSGNMDQIKGLREYMDAIGRAYGFENIMSASVDGYASGLGDTGPNGSRPNINLSLNRAKYVKELLSTLYHVEIPPNKVTPKGSPLSSNGKDNRPEDRRAELKVTISGSARGRVK